MRAAALRARARRATVRAAGWLGAAVRTAPGLAGAALVGYGAWSIYHPAGWIVAGGFLLLADRRMP